MHKAFHTTLLIISAVTCIFSQNRLVVFPDTLKEIASVGVLPFNIKSYHFTSGGVHEYNDAKTRMANSHFSNRIKQDLTQNGFNVTLIDSTHPDIALFREIKSQFMAVDRMIRLHIFGMQKFMVRIKNFDYTVGSVADICEKNNLDGLFVIWGYDEEMTQRRRKMIAGATAGSVASAIVGAFLGIGGNVAVPRSDFCFLCSAVINKDGRVVWYNCLPGEKKVDISHSADVQLLTSDLFRKLKRE
jgi:hypothetical protein